MKRSNNNSVLLFALVAAAAAAFTAGCSSHSETQAPAGMKVGAPLTQAQLQAAYQAKAQQRGVQPGNASGQ